MPQSGSRLEAKFGRGTANDLKYAVRLAGVWNIQPVDTPGSAGHWTSLALDPAGNPRISYYDISNGDLKFAEKNGGIWSAVTVDATGNVGQYTSLVLDGSGNPHISYYDGTANGLKYAVRFGTVWSSQTVDGPGTVGHYTSIALAPLGTVGISYYDGTNDDVKLALELCVATPYPGSLRLAHAAGTTTLAWTASDVGRFDVVRGDLRTLTATSGDFTAALNAITPAADVCLANDTTALTVGDTRPDPTAGNGYFYVLRGVHGCGAAGSYNTGAAGQIGDRDSEIALAGGTCP